MKLAGKTAIVTGAGMGIGRAIAILLTTEGADVVIAYISKAAADETAGEIQKVTGAGHSR